MDVITEGKQTKSRNIGIIISVGIHLLVLLCFLFIMAWRAPNPPIPEYGIELKFGLDNAGGMEDLAQKPQEVVEEAQQTENMEPLLMEKIDEEGVFSQETIQDNQLSTPTTSPKLQGNIEEEKIDQKKKDVKKTKSTKPVIKKEKEQEVKPATKLHVVYDKPKPKKNYGNNPNVKGDQGNEEGSLDSKALYGNQGGGVGLNLIGWSWDHIPEPHIPHNESAGRIEFEIKVDSNGEIIGYRVLERSLSIDTERACREAISKLTFTKKAGVKVPPVSVGKITFLVRTK